MGNDSLNGNKTTFIHCHSYLGLKITAVTGIFKVEAKKVCKKRLIKPQPTSFMADTLTTQPLRWIM